MLMLARYAEALRRQAATHKLESARQTAMEGIAAFHASAGSGVNSSDRSRLA